MKAESSIRGSEDRRRFSRLLDTAIAAERAEKTAQQRFQSACRKNFAPVWKTIKSINAEVRSRGLGSVTTESGSATSFGFEVICRFASTNCRLPITFAFDSDEASRVYISLGTEWSSRRKHAFSAAEVENCKSFVLSLAAEFFKSDE